MHFAQICTRRVRREGVGPSHHGDGWHERQVFRSMYDWIFLWDHRIAEDVDFHLIPRVDRILLIKSLWKFSPWSVNIDSSTPHLQMICSTITFAIIFASWFGNANASGHFVKWSSMTKMYWLKPIWSSWVDLQRQKIRSPKVLSLWLGSFFPILALVLLSCADSLGMVVPTLLCLCACDATKIGIWFFQTSSTSQKSS